MMVNVKPSPVAGSNEWQPIATAKPLPDAATVLLWYEGAKEPVFGHLFTYSHDGSIGASSSMARGVKFTHWMHLPAPPS